LWVPGMKRELRGVVEGREVIQRFGGREGDIVEALLSCAGLREGGRLRLESRDSVPAGWSHAFGSLARRKGGRGFGKGVIVR